MILQEDLETIVFLRNLGERHLAQVAQHAQLKECNEGTVVFSEGQDSSSIYFVLSGQVALEVRQENGKSLEVFTAQAGDLVGWSPVLGRSAMTATARAKTRCRLAVLDVRKILDLCETYPRFGLAFLREIGLTLSERLWATRHRLAGVCGGRPLGAIVESSD